MQARVHIYVICVIVCQEVLTCLPRSPMSDFWWTFLLDIGTCEAQVHLLKMHQQLFPISFSLETRHALIPMTYNLGATFWKCYWGQR